MRREFPSFMVLHKPALAPLLAYSAITAVAVIPAIGVSGPRGLMAVLHLVLLGAIVAALRLHGRWWTRLAEWLPLLAIPLLYKELPIVMSALGGSYHDAMVQGWEAALFGGQPSRTLAGAFPSRIMSETLHAAYLSYYPLIYVPPIVMYLRADRRTFDLAMFTLTLTFVVCYSCQAVLPVEGPRWEWGPPPGVPTGFFRSWVLRILIAGSSRGAALPSSHVAASIAQALSVWRWHRRAGVALLVLTSLLAAGAVYGGFHYTVDVVAGATTGLLIWGVAQVLWRGRLAQPAD